MSTPKDHISDHTPSASELARDEQPAALHYGQVGYTRPKAITDAEAAISASIVALNEQLVALIIEVTKHFCPNATHIDLELERDEINYWYLAAVTAERERVDLDEDGDEIEPLHEAINNIAGDLVPAFDERFTNDQFTIFLEDQS